MLKYLNVKHFETITKTSFYFIKLNYKSEIKKYYDSVYPKNHYLY